LRGRFAYSWPIDNFERPQNAPPEGCAMSHCGNVISSVAHSWAIRLATVAALGIASSPNAVQAEDYPARPVRIVVGYGPGASGDIVARIMAQALSKALNRQFTIENRAGAGSGVATTYVAHAAPDGYTLLQATVSNGIIAATDSNLTYDLVKDFAPITLFATLPNILVVNEGVPARSVSELIALARTRPDYLSFGSSGVGSGSHFSGELFNVMAGIKIQHVPYPGTAQAATDLLAGRIHVMFSPASTVLGFVAERRLVALASTGAQRAGAAPELPTIAEAALPGYDTSNWYGLLAPAGVPQEIVKRLAEACNEAVRSPDVIGPLALQGFDTLQGSPEAFADFIKTDVARWSRVAAAAGLKR
jgi:tripartite-type tricarboxylate transporter receptor subunit TctC